ncbi:hypothetical protein Dsin_002212 [Dipteronia sinensis]|uniref:Uncharacterized protein n=1 Tax=Dipteronia sinensis TaxID=43782 RepID=A0AAE0EJ64_9ROSI|nr:hypothetical protein Dsin_002212 [Dipteronia sinensis]
METQTDMERTELKESKSSRSNGHISPKNSEWLAEDLGGELRKGIPSGSDQGSPLLTPDQKLGMHKSIRQAASPSSGRGSSDFSLKEGTELSSSSSSSDSESESFNSSNYSGIPVTIDGDGFTEFSSLKKKIQEAEDDNADSLLEGRENGSYEELLGRIIEYEEKLRVSNLRLQLSEEEAARLKSELHTQIQLAQRDMKMREADLESERRKVFQLQNQITELETHVLESDFEIERLLRDLELTRERLGGFDEEIERLKNELVNEISEGTHLVQGQLKLAQEDVAMLNAELDSERRKVLESQERVVKYERDLFVCDDKIQELKFALSDAHENFTLEIAQLQSEISSLLEKQALGDERLKEQELLCKSLEEKIWKSEVENMETVDFYDRRERDMQDEITRLMEGVTEKGNHVEALNKDLDMLKLKHDMLMAEKDEVTAKVNTLMAEASSRDDRIRQMEEHMQRLHMEHTDLISDSEASWKLADELRVRVTELEKEVDRQRIVISDRAEEKREAIRQLCFSLEHYRSGYKELREAFLGIKRPTVIMAA